MPPLQKIGGKNRNYVNTVWLNLSRNNKIRNTVDQNAQEDLRSLEILKRLEELCIQEYARNAAGCL